MLLGSGRELASRFQKLCSHLLKVLHFISTTFRCVERNRFGEALSARYRTQGPRRAALARHARRLRPVNNKGRAAFISSAHAPSGGDMTDKNDPLLEPDAESEVIRLAIEHDLSGDIAKRALAWLDKVDDMLAVLRAEMPDLVKEFGL
jgi:hypothetical protein